MIVTQRWCSNCYGDGWLVDVVKYGEGPGHGLPLHLGQADFDNHERRKEEDGYYGPEYGDVLEISKPYLCSDCEGAGFYFYVETQEASEEPVLESGAVVFLKDLPANAVLCDISGPSDWVAKQERVPVRKLEPVFIRR